MSESERGHSSQPPERDEQSLGIKDDLASARFSGTNTEMAHSSADEILACQAGIALAGFSKTGKDMFRCPV